MRRERFVTEAANMVVAAAHIGRTIQWTKGTAGTVTLPRDSAAEIPIGGTVDVLQLGAGQVTMTAGAGVTLRASGGKVKTAAQYARVRATKIAADTWLVSGDAAT